LTFPLKIGLIDNVHDFDMISGYLTEEVRWHCIFENHSISAFSHYFNLLQKNLEKLTFGLLLNKIKELRSHVLHGVQIPHGQGQFLGRNGQSIVNYRDTLQSSAKTAQPIDVPFGFWARMSPRKHVLDVAQIPALKGAILMDRCPRFI